MSGWRPALPAPSCMGWWSIQIGSLQSSHKHLSHHGFPKTVVWHDWRLKKQSLMVLVLTLGKKTPFLLPWLLSSSGKSTHHHMLKAGAVSFILTLFN